MKDQGADNPRTVHVEHGEDVPSQPTRRYSSPLLTHYGSVSRLTLSGGLTTTEGQSGMGMAASEPALKTNAVQVGTHPLGIGLYLFDYKPEYQAMWGAGRQFGVMADEVERVLPQAVSVHPQGYRVVDYSMLGIARATI